MTSDGPLISIVLPVYNGGRSLAGAIASCIRQTYGNWELIVVDDASTDRTPEIVAECCRQDARVRYIRNDCNVKLPATLNRGFDAARGALFTWTSHDNEYLPEALAAMTSMLDRYPEVDLVYADMMLMDADGRDKEVARRQQPNRLGFRGNVVGGCFLYRRAIAERVGAYPTDLFLVEDYYYWLRVADQGNLGHLPRTLYRYRIHEQSLSSRFANRRAVGRVALERALRLTRRRTLKAAIYCNMALDDHAEKDCAAARANLRRALSIAPGAVLARSSWRLLWEIVSGVRSVEQ